MIIQPERTLVSDARHGVRNHRGPSQTCPADRLGCAPGAMRTDRRRAVGPAPAQVTGMSGQGGADQSRFMQARARAAREG